MTAWRSSCALSWMPFRSWQPPPWSRRCSTSCRAATIQCVLLGVVGLEAGLSGAKDRCTPVGQAREFYQALMGHDVDSELVIYAEEGHGVSRFAAVTDYHPADGAKSSFPRQMHLFF